MQAARNKKPFSLLDYAIPTNKNTFSQFYDNKTANVNCICHKKEGKWLKCFYCGEAVHQCIDTSNNRNDKYECYACLNKEMDPLFQVKKTLFQTFFITKSIYVHRNEIIFEFDYNSQQIGKTLELRGIKAGKTQLSWPMQGCFFLNDEKVSLCELRPKQINLNRKYRVEQYIFVQTSKLKLGKNTLKFLIYQLQKSRFSQKFKAEEEGTYYLSINAINKLTPEGVIADTFKTRRKQKIQSIAMLKNSGQAMYIADLLCPYTKQKIKVPVRGKHCTHFNCICLETLIAIHRGSRQWRCPICTQRINQPVVDMFIYFILKDQSIGSKVIIFSNGSYRSVEKQDNFFNLDDQRPQSKVQVTQVKNLTEKLKVFSVKQGVKSQTKIMQKQFCNSQQISQSINIDVLEQEKLNQQQSMAKKILMKIHKLRQQQQKRVSQGTQITKTDRTENKIMRSINQVKTRQMTEVAQKQFKKVYSNGGFKISDRIKEKLKKQPKIRSIFSLIL